MSGAARDAVLAVDKPAGPTSHDVVGLTRRALDTRRVGHTGTLDPFASGLMLLCIGRSTRISQYLTGLPKSYEAIARLGVETDTLDSEGEVTARADASTVTLDAVEAALAGLRGDILQVPPQYSAKKVDGVAMHRRARQGEYVALDPRPVTVYALEALALEGADLRFRVRCSSGTYVRALARDLGAALGVGAHLTALRRTEVGGFSVEGALGLDELDDPARVAAAWIDPLDALGHLPRVEVDAAGATTLGYGQPLPLEGAADAPVVVVASDGALAAIGSVSAGRLQPRKVFVG